MMQLPDDGEWHLVKLVNGCIYLDGVLVERLPLDAPRAIVIAA